MSATHEADTGRASYELHHLPPHTDVPSFQDVRNYVSSGWGGGAAAGSSAGSFKPSRRGRSGSRLSVSGIPGGGSRSSSRQRYGPSQSSSSHHGSNFPPQVQNAFAELRRHLGADSSDNASNASYRTDDTAEETAPKKRGNGDGPLRALRLDSIDSVDTGSAFETIVPQTYRVQQPQ